LIPPRAKKKRGIFALGKALAQQKKEFIAGRKREAFMPLNIQECQWDSFEH